MWWPLVTMHFIHMSGNAFCLLGENTKNPEGKMNPTQIIPYWGYTSEVHKVITANGFIEQVYKDFKQFSSLGKRPVVFLQHGVLALVTNWISNMPNNSLGFLLVDAGYDVRGNTWAQENLYYSPWPKRWSFSFNISPSNEDPRLISFKMDWLDLLAVQGTLKSFVAFSTNPTLAEKIEVFHALAPVATVKHTQSLFNKLALIPHFLFKIIFGVEVCSHEALDVRCKNALFAITGVDYKNLNMICTRLDVYVAHNPAGTSVQNAVKSGKFQAFDWGASVQNLMHHHQVSVLTMNVPIAIWNGGKDLLADPQDVDLLLSKLPNLIYHKEIPNYNHLDLIWAVDAPQEVYNEIVSLVAEDKKQF
uniref:Partial AB-hydrolase lipase domain-containing protein n=1 Tax=Capra hircus TaxID=9925 RepID=A0A452ESZ9_CAPHI